MGRDGLDSLDLTEPGSEGQGGENVLTLQVVDGGNCLKTNPSRGDGRIGIAAAYPAARHLRHLPSS
jgi:hypothetical protein